MDSKILMGLAAVVLYFMNKSAATIDTPDELPTGDEEDNGSQIVVDESDYIPQVQKDLSVTPSIIFYDVNAKNWRGTITWRIKNNSKTTTYNIATVRSTLAVMGFVSVWVPGRRDVMRRVAPGQTVEIDATIVDKWFFAGSDKTARSTVNKTLNDNFKKPLSMLMANIDIDAWSSNNQMKTLCSYENVQGTVTLDGKVYYPGYRGEYNASKWEWTEENGFRKS